MQANFDSILADVNAYANTIKLSLDDKSYDTKVKMERAYNDLYAKMDKYVGDVLKTKTQAVNEMQSLLNQYRQNSDSFTEDMNEAVNDFETKAT